MRVSSPGQRAWRFLLVAVVAVTVASNASIPFAQALSTADSAPQAGRTQIATNSTNAASCPDVAIYGVRGSAQDYAADDEGMGPEVAAFAHEVLRRLPTTLRVEQIGVPYPAANPLEAGFNEFTDDLSPYNHSVSSGVSLLLNGRSDFESPPHLLSRCPRTAVIMAGISQGAQVITTALSNDSPDSTLERKLSAVVLLASPVRLTDESIDIGAQDQDGVLTFPTYSQPGQRPAVIPATLWPRTRSYCLQDDPVCDNTDVLNLAPSSDRPQIHTSYAQSLFILQAADFAVSRVWASRNEVEPRNGFTPAPLTYVAIGDSYAAGEGTNDYFVNTENGKDSCHRSPLSDSSLLGVEQSKFVACSGATTNDMQHAFKTEQPQVNANLLNRSVDLVTVSAGGDDLGFAGVLQQCTDIPVISPKSDADCEESISQALKMIPVVRSDVSSFLSKIHSLAPHARIMIIGYPRLWTVGGYWKGCNGIDQVLQQRLNNADAALDLTIQSVAKDSKNSEFVDTWNAFTGHEVCGRPDGATEYVNDLQIHCPNGNGSQKFAVCSESYHPTPAGYIALRSLVFEQLDRDLSPKGSVGANPVFTCDRCSGSNPDLPRLTCARSCEGSDGGLVMRVNAVGQFETPSEGPAMYVTVQFKNDSDERILVCDICFKMQIAAPGVLNNLTEFSQSAYNVGSIRNPADNRRECVSYASDYGISVAPHQTLVLPDDICISETPDLPNDEVVIPVGVIYKSGLVSSNEIRIPVGP